MEARTAPKASTRSAAEERPFDRPLVSVVVATFNRAHMIEHALTSVTGQTYRPLEAIVVDDGSTDDTEAVVDRVRAATELPILYMKQGHAGCAAARNTGVGLAHGEFVAFLDSDDRWMPTAAEALTEALLRSGADFAYAPSVEVFPDTGREIVERPPAAGRPEAFAVEHFLRHGVRQGACMFRRAIFLELGGMDESLRHNEDSDFVQRMAVRHTGTYVDLPTVRCYHHSGNKSADRPSIYEALLTSAVRVLAEFPEFGRVLGRRACTKLHNLNVSLVEELLLAGRMDDARDVAARVGGRLPLTVRIAFATRRTRLLRNRRYAEWVVRSVARRIRNALQFSTRQHL